MRDYVILTDSSCDLPAEMAQQLEVTVLPLTFQIQGKEYANYLDGREIGFHEFYELIRSGEQSVTSAVNMDSWMAGMRPLLEEGKDLLVLAFSSGLSNTYNAAQLAAKELKGQYPDRRIYVVDTLSASLGEGLLVYLAVEKKRQGLSCLPCVFHQDSGFLYGKQVLVNEFHDAHPFPGKRLSSE